MDYDKEQLRQLIEKIENGIRASGDSITNNHDAFCKEFMKTAQEFANSLPNTHDDPNVHFIFATSVLLAAWSGCVPRAKWFRPLSEPDGAGQLSDNEQRKNFDTIHEGWEIVLVAFFRMGREIASAFRRGRGQPVYDDWLKPHS